MHHLTFESAVSLPKCLRTTILRSLQLIFFFLQKYNSAFFIPTTLALPDVVGARKNRIESADNISDVLEVKTKYAVRRKRISVADPDPGSGIPCLFDPGPGFRIRDLE